MLHERLSEARETVFILKERAAELTSADRDLEMGNFYSNMDQLSLYLTRLRVYFENIADDLSESTLNVFIPEMLINICLLLFLVMLGPLFGHNVLKL